MANIYRGLIGNLSGCPESALERQLIAEYLLSQGYSMMDLQEMPPEEKKALMMKACVYAALRLANIEAKSQFRQKIKPP
jgi:hypothetical protein